MLLCYSSEQQEEYTYQAEIGCYQNKEEEGSEG